MNYSIGNAVSLNRNIYIYIYIYIYNVQIQSDLCHIFVTLRMSYCLPFSF